MYRAKITLNTKKPDGTDYVALDTSVTHPMTIEGAIHLATETIRREMLHMSVVQHLHMKATLEVSWERDD